MCWFTLFSVLAVLKVRLDSLGFFVPGVTEEPRMRLLSLLHCTALQGMRLGPAWQYLPLVSREWKDGSNSSYNCTPFLHSLLTKGKNKALRLIELIGRRFWG